MDKKYELVMDDTIQCWGHTLYRIRALKGFYPIYFVKPGTLGGYIEKEENLSQSGNAWVWHNAKVYCDAKVFGDAQVLHNAVISDNALVFEKAHVCGNAEVFTNAEVYGNGQVYGLAQIHGNARVRDRAKVCDSAHIFNDAVIYGDAHVRGWAEIFGNAAIYENSHYLTIGPINGGDDRATFFRGREKEILVNCGCFRGDIDAFLKRVQVKYGDNIHGQAYRKAVELAQMQIDLS